MDKINKESMKTVKWKIHLKSCHERVFQYLNSAIGREQFWAEKAPEKDGVIHFTFPNGECYKSRIVQIKPNVRFHVEYFNSDLKIELSTSKDGGTDLLLINEGVIDSEFADINAGWVSVLLNFKAVIDYEVDLRNHDMNRTWDQNYADN
ncbi:MAG: hypothetical protein BAJALOKI3v1_1220003 [Promethearchaeota archaeon]|nr:MAG: hypothetical protein BAJALOKI3v1_1220003 [Candidatus Lokiarchaeota archaeon]